MAYSKGRVVGCGLMKIDGPDQDHYYGHGGLVHPKYRGQGIYHRILKKRLAIKEGGKPMFVRPIDYSNKSLISMFEKLGFILKDNSMKLKQADPASTNAR